MDLLGMKMNLIWGRRELDGTNAREEGCVASTQRGNGQLGHHQTTCHNYKTKKANKDIKSMSLKKFLLFLFLSLLPIFDNTKIASYTILCSHSVQRTHRPWSTSLSHPH